MSTFHGTGAGHILVVQQLEILPDVLCRVTGDQILDHEGHVISLKVSQYLTRPLYSRKMASV